MDGRNREAGSVALAIIGSRGVPARYGGFETFAEHLALHMRGRGVGVCVVGEQGPVTGAAEGDPLEGVELRATRTLKGRNPFLYYLESALKIPAGCSAVLCLGPGGIIAWPICLLRGMRFIVNLDGLNSRRTKWPPHKRVLFRLLESLVAALPVDKVLDSEALRGAFRVPAWARSRVHVIEYGAVDIASLGDTEDDAELIGELGVDLASGYDLVVARLEPENSIEMIVSAHRLSESPRPLVVVGNWGSVELERRVRAEAAPHVLFAGAIHDQSVLHALRRSASAYLHGHQVGGTNPSLVEAMAAGSAIVAHDNPFNRTTLAGSQASYFGSRADLAVILAGGPLRSPGEGDRSPYEVYREKYRWDLIGARYERLLGYESQGAARA
jgi:glycosyltransferase involved in cell wall biosynthesis